MGLVIQTNYYIKPQVHQESHVTTYLTDEVSGMFKPPNTIYVRKAPHLPVIMNLTHESVHFLQHNHHLKGKDYLLFPQSPIEDRFTYQRYRNFLLNGSHADITNSHFVRTVVKTVIKHYTKKELPEGIIYTCSLPEVRDNNSRPTFTLPYHPGLELLKMELMPVIMEMMTAKWIADYFNLSITIPHRPLNAPPAYTVAQNIAAFLLSVHPHPEDFYIPTEYDDPDDARQSLKFLLEETSHEPEMIRYLLSN